MSRSRENRFHTLDTSALLVTFFSDHSVKGTGFVLEFQTKGDQIPSSTEIELQHRHHKLESRPTPEVPFGPVTIQAADLSIDTFAFHHVEPANSSVSVEITTENLEIQQCNQDSIAFYHMPTIGKYELLSKVPRAEVCSVEKLMRAGIPPVTSFLAKNRENVKPKGVLVAVTRVKEGKTEKSVSFKFE